MSDMSIRRLCALLLLAVVAALLPSVTVSAHTAPLLVATPSSGPVGTETVITGSGFPASMKGKLTVGQSRSNIRTSRSGAFSQPVTIPDPGTSGTVTVRADVGSAWTTTEFAVTSSSPTTPDPAASTVLQFGVSTPSGLWGGSELDEVAQLVGEKPSTVLSFSDFTRAPDLDGLRNIASRGATPMVTLEPWVAGHGVVQQDYTLDAVAAGKHDAHLKSWAAAFEQFGQPVLLRFAHEMNGSWYPWAEGVNGNEPGDYVKAWRHVYNLVEPIAPNVEWVWAPNVPYSGSVPLAGLYPGAGYVDVLGLDGYNFGTSQSWSSWITPDVLLGEGLAQLRALGPDKPIVVTETASSEIGGSKADWNKALVSYLAAQPNVTGLVWFHHNKETDWRINSSPASAVALNEALAARRAG